MMKRRIFAFLLAAALCLGLGLPAAASTNKNPAWMELYWAAFLRYIEDEAHQFNTDFGRYAYIDMFDFNGDDTPEMILNARLHTIREGEVVSFDGDYTFDLRRNKTTGEEKFILHEYGGTCGSYEDIYVEYHIDWVRLVLTRGEVIAHYSESDTVYETTRKMEYEGEEVTSITEFRSLQAEFLDTWVLVHYMSRRQTLVEGHSRVEQRRSFFRALQRQGYDVPQPPMPSKAWYFGGAGALLLAGGAVLGILLWRKKRKQKQHRAELPNGAL